MVQTVKKEKIFGKDIPLLVTIISLLFLVIPFVILKYSFVVLGVLILIELYMLFNNIKGFLIFIFAYSLTIPYVSSSVKTGATHYITSVLIFIAYFFFAFIKKSKFPYRFRGLFQTILILLFITLFYTIRNSNLEEFRILILFLLSTFGVFYLSFLDRLNLKEFLFLLNILFFFTVLFTVQEIILKNSPYQFIYEEQTLDFQIRAKGLLGHPLVLSSFLSFFQCALLIKLLIYKKFDLISFILLIPCAILSASRTALILIILAWLVYIIISKSYRKTAFLLIFFSFVLFSIIIYSYIIDFLGPIWDRISDASVAQRLGSYSVAYDIFSNNILGVGLSRDAFSAEISKLKNHAMNANYDSSFLIFDNGYLTALVGFGFFAFMIFAIYVQPLLYLIKNKIKSPDVYFQSFFLVFVIWAAQNFSFDTIFYFPTNCLYFMITGFIIKEKIAASRIVKNVKNPFEISNLIPQTN